MRFLASLPNQGQPSAIGYNSHRLLRRQTDHLLIMEPVSICDAKDMKQHQKGHDKNGRYRAFTVICWDSYQKTSIHHARRQLGTPINPGKVLIMSYIYSDEIFRHYVHRLLKDMEPHLEGTAREVTGQAIEALKQVIFSKLWPEEFTAPIKFSWRRFVPNAPIELPRAIGTVIKVTEKEFEVKASEKYAKWQRHVYWNILRDDRRFSVGKIVTFEALEDCKRQIDLNECSCFGELYEALDNTEFSGLHLPILVSPSFPIKEEK